jgi:hypothetical protein
MAIQMMNKLADIARRPLAHFLQPGKYRNFAGEVFVEGLDEIELGKNTFQWVSQKRNVSRCLRKILMKTKSEMPSDVTYPCPFRERLVQERFQPMVVIEMIQHRFTGKPVSKDPSHRCPSRLWHMEMNDQRVHMRDYSRGLIGNAALQKAWGSLEKYFKSE